MAEQRREWWVYFSLPLEREMISEAKPPIVGTYLVREVLPDDVEPDTARSLQAEVERLRDDLDAVRLSHGKLCRAMKSAMHLKLWPEIPGPFTEGACKLLLSHVATIEAENARLRAMVGELEGCVDVFVHQGLLPPATATRFWNAMGKAKELLRKDGT